MKGSQLVFNYVRLLCYRCHKINTNCGGSCIDSPDWIKNKRKKQQSPSKKKITNVTNAITVALNHDEVKKIRK